MLPCIVPAFTQSDSSCVPVLRPCEPQIPPWRPANIINSAFLFFSPLRSLNGQLNVANSSLHYRCVQRLSFASFCHRPHRHRLRRCVVLRNYILLLILWVCWYYIRLCNIMLTQSYFVLIHSFIPSFPCSAITRSIYVFWVCIPTVYNLKLHFDIILYSPPHPPTQAQSKCVSFTWATNTFIFCCSIRKHSCSALVAHNDDTKKGRYGRTVCCRRR